MLANFIDSKYKANTFFFFHVKNQILAYHVTVTVWCVFMVVLTIPYWQQTSIKVV